MIHHRESDSRGHADFGWLNSYHTFSFGEYYDQKFMGFSTLRVINEDFVAASTGFPTHGHKDMEIITYMVEGVLEHKDTLGNSELLKAGEVQRMTAGKGVRHSEFNHEANSRVHLLQIWILPDTMNLDPSYQQRSFTEDLSSKQLTLLVSPNEEKGSLKIHQDVKLYGLKSSEKVDFSLPLDPKRKYYLQVVKGNPKSNGAHLAPGDGLALQAETQLTVVADQGCEFLFFDLPQ